MTPSPILRRSATADLTPMQCRDSHRICSAIEAAVAAAFAVPIREMRSASRRAAPTAFARQSAMYLAHVALGLSYTEIGRAFGRDRTTASHACRLVEERRDDPTVDSVLGALENAITTVDNPVSLRGEAWR